jgi:imidazole glycerol-phosphate synthase subunit HisH
MIAIVDYGLGNVGAIANIYKRLGIATVLARTEGDLAAATHVILPGVGAFDWAMKRLSASGMIAALDRRVRDDRVPTLGICVGMQMMACRSEEGSAPGLGWIEADVKRFDPSAMHGRAPLPHMGWNDVEPRTGEPLFAGMGADARFYFLHSYFFAPYRDDVAIATTEYGGRFVAAARSGNVAGVQFHPEKSHQWGIHLLKNFAEI